MTLAHSTFLALPSRLRLLQHVIPDRMHDLNIMTLSFFWIRHEKITVGSLKNRFPCSFFTVLHVLILQVVFRELSIKRTR